jgi:hypothetical protein
MNGGPRPAQASRGGKLAVVGLLSIVGTQRVALCPTLPPNEEP